ncbi:MAG: hypothetical protein ACJ8R9_07940 [Steroidobacteraceae bacterium]
MAPAGTGAPGDAIGSAGGSASSGAASAGSGADGGASPDSPGGSALPRNRAQTSDERRAALDKRLDDSLGSFDAQLRKEQQKIALERDSRQATVTTVAPDGSTTVSSDENVGAGDERTTDRPHEPVGSHRGATDSRSPRSGDLKSDRTAGGPVSSSGNGAVASEIPDGNDDDVIARRLRKAAEQETDPELRDKLWKEYVEYKRNAQGQ